MGTNTGVECKASFNIDFPGDIKPVTENGVQVNAQNDKHKDYKHRGTRSQKDEKRPRQQIQAVMQETGGGHI